MLPREEPLMVAVEEPFLRLFPDSKRVEDLPVALAPATHAVRIVAGHEAVAAPEQ
jgi:hypothetical protein